MYLDWEASVFFIDNQSLGVPDINLKRILNRHQATSRQQLFNQRYGITRQWIGSN
jgi:hypothetical protein